ncbi:MAG: hypothetical protein QNK37_15235 [Acidobacteriota bacterium]|nr:hypothetical protein [Acidobacteriota bacterium]
MIDWHRLLGLVFSDFFSDTGYEVELEKDLSLKKQLLDILVIYKEQNKPLYEEPDGLDNMSQYNLMTYKSMNEPLNRWAVEELHGHFVNFRKSLGKPLTPYNDFSLYAVATRFPSDLAGQVDLKRIKTGVYEVQWGIGKIRVIVLGELPKTRNNAVWNLFSGIAEKVTYGQMHYHWRNPDASTVIDKLFEKYNLEGLKMSYTLEDFQREYRKEIIDSLTAEERLAGMPPEELLAGMPPEERLAGMQPEERLAGMQPEELRAALPPEELRAALPPEERLVDLSPEVIIETLVRQLSRDQLDDLKRQIDGFLKP